MARGFLYFGDYHQCNSIIELLALNTTENGVLGIANEADIIICIANIHLQSISKVLNNYLDYMFYKKEKEALLAKPLVQ